MDVCGVNRDPQVRVLNTFAVLVKAGSRKLCVRGWMSLYLFGGVAG